MNHRNSDEDSADLIETVISSLGDGIIGLGTVGTVTAVQFVSTPSTKAIVAAAGATGTLFISSS